MRVRAAMVVIIIRFASGQSPQQTAPANRTLVFVAGGDTIGRYHSLQGMEDPGFRHISQLFQNGGVSFANQEGSLFDLASFLGYPNDRSSPLTKTAR